MLSIVSLIIEDCRTVKETERSEFSKIEYK